MITAMGLGSPRNGMPAPGGYRWRGRDWPEPKPAVPRPQHSHIPGWRAQRLALLAGMRVSESNLPADRLPRGVITVEEAARRLGVSMRTIERDLAALRTYRAAGRQP
jgi:DeoR-like helix-turn-helix domain